MKKIEDAEHNNLFETWLNDKSVLKELDGSLLVDILDRVLYRKVLKGELRAYREACREELANREYQNRVEKKANDILQDLRVMFCAKEALWKNIRDGEQGLATRKLRKYGRMIGLAVNDMSNVPTNLYTLNALTNIVNKKSNLNTDEHFYSLYANAGPDMFYDALAKDIKFDINDLGALVYKYNQTLVSTCQENNVLAVYHRNNEMVDPQTSYRECGIHQLVYFPQKPTLIKEAWHYLFREEWGMDPEEIQAPFSNVISLQYAAFLRPELKVLLPKQDSINRFE